MPRSVPRYDWGMETTTEVLVKAGGWWLGTTVRAYGNRLEVGYPRMLTLGLTRRWETYPYSAMEGVEVRGGTVRFRLGTLSYRSVRVGGRKAKKIMALVREAM